MFGLVFPSLLALLGELGDARDQIWDFKLSPSPWGAGELLPIEGPGLLSHPGVWGSRGTRKSLRAWCFPLSWASFLPSFSLLLALSHLALFLSISMSVSVTILLSVFFLFLCLFVFFSAFSVSLCLFCRCVSLCVALLLIVLGDPGRTGDVQTDDL